MAVYLWAFAALTASPGARAFYDAHRGAGDTRGCPGKRGSLRWRSPA